MAFGWIPLETALPTCHLTSHANHRYHAIRDEDRRHARGRLRRYDRDLDSDHVATVRRAAEGFGHGSREERRTAVVAAPRDAAG